MNTNRKDTQTYELEKKEKIYDKSNHNLTFQRYFRFTISENETFDTMF